MQPPPEGQSQPPQQPYYPPQQQYGPPPYQQPPMYQPPPKRKRRRWPFVLLGILIVACAIVGIAVATSNGGSPSPASNTSVSTTKASTPASTPTPTQVPKWTTTQTFSGSGTKKTGTFSVPDDWKLTWTCKPSSFYGGQYNVQVYVYNSDGSLADVAINDLCKSGTTSGETEEHQAGSIYLDINSEGSWTVQVQELK